MRTLPIISIVLALGAALSQGREAQARFELQDGTEGQGSFVRIRADSVEIKIPDGDSNRLWVVHRFDMRKVQLVENDSLVDLNRSDFELADLPVAKTDLAKPKPSLSKGNAYIKVESDPPESRIYVDGFLLSNLLTPALVPKLSIGKHTIVVRKFLKGVDWWGLAEVNLQANDTAVVVIPLLKPRTQLKVQSVPSGAEFYLNASPSLNHLPKYHSDYTLRDLRPGPDQTLHFFKVGYYDTVVTVNVEYSMPNLVSVEMRSITEDLDKLEEQKKFVAKRTRRFLGRISLYASVAPLLAGGTFLFLANQDWNEANKAKASYDDAAFQSEVTDQLLERNRSYNDKGDSKATIAAICGAAAGSLLALGIALQF